MAIKSFSDIVTDMINFIKLKRPDADTLEGTVLRDLVVEAVSNEIATAYGDISTLQKAPSVVYADQLTVDEMDALAANYDLTRKQATYATGFATFSAFNKPVADVQIGAGDGSGGSIVSTRTLANGSIVQFVTTQTVFLRTSAIIDPTYGTYDVTAPVVAVFSGSTGNVGANNVVVLQQPIPGINTVSNRLATSGGTDIESNVDLANRIVAKAQARNLGTKPGYRSLVIEQEGIQDASVVGPGDADAVRDQYGNEVDIYLLGTNPVQAQQMTTFYNTNLNYTLDFKPVVSVIGIVGLSNAIPFTFSQGVDYNLSIDSTTPYAHSIRASDKIVWTVFGNKPDNVSPFTISYIYDKNVADTQLILEDPANKVLTADVLTKQGTQVIIDIGFVATATGGYDKAIVLTSIIDALNTYIAGTGLGARIEQSDLVYRLRNEIPGIASIYLPFTTLSRRVTPGSNQFLQAKQTEYFRFDGISLIGITVV